MRIHELQRSDLSHFALSHWLKESDLLRLSATFPGGAQFTDSILEQVWVAIARRSHPQKVEQLRRVGLESLHRWLSASQIHEISADVNGWVNQHIFHALNEFIEDGLQVRQKFYLSTLSVVRFYVPWETFVKDEKIYRDSRYFDLKIHNPHLDSWFAFPAETINIWVSLGRIQSTNGMLFYPDAPKVPSPSDPDEPPKDWALGLPQPVYGPAREILLFGGDVPHGTCVNRSDETRISATFRFFLDRPDKRTRYFFLYRHGGKSFEGSLGRRVSKLLVGVRKRKFMLWAWGRGLGRDLQSRVLGIWRNRVTKRWPQKVRPGSLSIRKSENTSGIEAISDSRCRVLTKTGWVSFQRHCPHRGADLSQGSFDGSKVRCAWHNVGFSLESGNAECSGIGTLRIYRD